MRSRYSAFAKRDAGYLLRTWATETRPLDLGDLSEREWTGLTIHDSGVEGGDSGHVRFSAEYVSRGRKGVMHETSRFRRENGAWIYVDGESS